MFINRNYLVEKRMAQDGGYDLNDGFIDDGDLEDQATAVTVCLCVYE